MPSPHGQVRIGASGFSYEHWDGIFYPPNLPKARRLEHYSSEFDTVELNNTFYRLPNEATFDSWNRRAPNGFLFALKLSRYITHVKLLSDVEESVEVFLRRAERLGQHLGPILIQLPPRLHFDIPRLESFLQLCTRDLRWAVEFRHPSWLSQEAFEMLRHHRVALCIHDLLEQHPWEITAPFVYVRYHGPSGHYSGDYPPQHLRTDATHLAQLSARGLDVYAYFNNDAQGHAVKNARMLKNYLSEAKANRQPSSPAR